MAERGRGRVVRQAVDILDAILDRLGEQSFGIARGHAGLADRDVEIGDVDRREALARQRRVAQDTSCEQDDHDGHHHSRHAQNALEEVHHECCSALALACSLPSAVAPIGVSSVLASTLWPGWTYSCPPVITLMVSGSPTTHTPSRVSLTILTAWNATLFPSSTVRMPRTPLSSRVSTDWGSTCAGAVPTTTSASAVMPSRILPVGLGIEISIGNDRVASSAVGAMYVTLPFALSPVTVVMSAERPSRAYWILASGTEAMNSIGSSCTIVAQGVPSASIEPTVAAGSLTVPPTLALIVARSSSSCACSRPVLAWASADWAASAVFWAARPCCTSDWLESNAVCACCTAALAWSTASCRAPLSSTHSVSPDFTTWPFCTSTSVTMPEVWATTLTCALALVRPRSGTSIDIGCAWTTAIRTERGAADAPLPVASVRSAMVCAGSTPSDETLLLMPDLSTAFVSGPPFFSINDTTGFSPAPGPWPPLISVPVASQTASTRTLTSATP